MSKPSLEDAILLATQLHRGQKDLAGEYYILHPLRVMLDSTILTEEERIVSVLHDVVEDCDITFEQLRELDYSDNVVEALSFLTKRPEEESDYDAFIERIRKGPVLARRVKLSDLRDNQDLSRIFKPGTADINRRKKYFRASAILEATLY